MRNGLLYLGGGFTSLRCVSSPATLRSRGPGWGMPVPVASPDLSVLLGSVCPRPHRSAWCDGLQGEDAKTLPGTGPSLWVHSRDQLTSVTSPSGTTHGLSELSEGALALKQESPGRATESGTSAAGRRGSRRE